ncbi:HK97 family phage prohead protease [Aurantiacibacter aquimixticola]|uniref:HK97 family phage prohead protease n=1 Tax=Aurantiacibacter aquimixticola TaxID=1958945 RepID=A0A419RV81_9SPHN|nr:HK97 family phage prohead protease [Aurantiacibacter aquimixticola]RJY09691.1 HK97 family phage prohead protease [Aurantiacibacter aquimixticola]
MRIAGYAALFDIADGAKDTIRPGAFARTLAERRDPIPLFWQHRPDQRIGSVELAQEDDRGLRVIARIDNPESRAVSALLSKAANGLSFGYRARGFRRSPAGRVLEDIDLFEVSLVTRPLQHGARIHLIS